MPVIPKPSDNGTWYVDETDKNGVYTKVWVQDKGIDSNTFLGPYATEADAKQAAEGIVGTKTLTGWRGLIAQLQVGATAVKSVGIIGNPLSGVAAIGDFFSRLGQANVWIRAVEVLLGLGLIVVGVAKLAGGTSLGRTAVKAAGTAALL